jgi:hypothetical protein
MAEAASIKLELGGDPDNQEIICHVHIHDEKHKDHEATFRVVAEVKVHDSRGVDGETVLHEETFRITQPDHVIKFPRAEILAYSYYGNMIDIEIHTRVIIDDAMLFDTKVSTEQELELGLKPPAEDGAKEIVEPDDDFFFFTNLKAIPLQNQLITLGLAVVGGIIILINMAIGAHDQFSPPGAVYFYDHFDSDGDGESPLVKALTGSGALGAMVWFAIRGQLRKYMKFHFKTLPDMIVPDEDYVASSLFGGRSRVALENVTLRIVASNMECGQYVRGSGTNRRTVSFTEPIRGVILFEKQAAYIPARTPIADYFNDRFSFTPMFEMLYPPVSISSTHGVKVHWEVQLIHPEFIDQELVGSDDLFAYEHFLRP